MKRVYAESDANSNYYMAVFQQKTIKSRVILISAVILIMAVFALAQKAVSAEDYGLSVTAEGTGLPTADTDISTIIGKIVGAGLAFIGIIFFILIIYGGFLWMTARGDEAQVTKAKDLIVSAAIGLIIVLSAYAITYYVGGVFDQTPK